MWIILHPFFRIGYTNQFKKLNCLLMSYFFRSIIMINHSLHNLSSN